MLTDRNDKALLLNARRKIWIWFIGVLLIAAVILFVPYKSTISPEWQIHVVDGWGKPISGLRVAEEWSYFGIDFNPMMDFANTDSTGQVSFPRCTIWASLASRSLNPQGASERLGPSVRVLACDEDHFMQGEFFWDGNRFQVEGMLTKQIRVVAKPVQHCTMM